MSIRVIRAKKKTLSLSRRLKNQTAQTAQAILSEWSERLPLGLSLVNVGRCAERGKEVLDNYEDWQDIAK